MLEKAAYVKMWHSAKTDSFIVYDLSTLTDQILEEELLVVPDQPHHAFEPLLRELLNSTKWISLVFGFLQAPS